jgi:hypothetical protein
MVSPAGSILCVQNYFAPANPTFSGGTPHESSRQTVTPVGVGLLLDSDACAALWGLPRTLQVGQNAA